MYLEYNGEWKNLNNSWEWIGSGSAKGVMVDRSIKFLDFVETIYKRTGIKQSEYTLKIMHKATSERCKNTTPILISDDADISDLLSLYEDQNEIIIHVMLEPMKGKGKAICVDNNDDVDNFDDGGRYFSDDYFGLHILDNDIYVQNEAFNCSQDLVQICGANNASNESIYGTNNDGVPTEVNDSMSLQVDCEFVEDRISHLNNLICQKKMIFDPIHWVMVGMMDLILLWANTSRARKH